LIKKWKPVTILKKVATPKSQMSRKNKQINKMKITKLYIMIGFVVVFVIKIKAQQALPYYTGFDTPTEQAGWLLYKLGVNGTYGPWRISGGGFSAPSCLFHDYNNSGTVEDWYVSPALNFTTPSKIALKIKVFVISGTVYATDYIGIWYSSGSQDPNLDQYTEVANLTSLASNSNLWLDTTVNLPFTAGTGYIGLKYKNVNNWFTPSIDNINVTALTVGIAEIESENGILIYPNPTTGKIVIESKSNINSIEIDNVLGERTYTTSNFKQQTSSEIDLYNYPKGIYFVKIYDGEKIYTKKIVIQ
jgi:hypothetical protein